MKWHAGDFWKVTIKDLSVDEPFEYKYVVLDFKTKAAIRWEQGRNRICDPSYLSEEACSKSDSSLFVLDDWEHFTITFSIYFPGQSEKEVMRINGDTEKLGSWNKGTGPILMERGEPREWLTGQTVRPWEHKLIKFSQSSMPSRLIYKYSIINLFDDVIIWEREPSRVLEILDPSEYLKYKNYGTIPNSDLTLEWRNVDQVFLVNGHIEKVDANFVGGLTFDKIDDTKIFLGPYPQTEQDTETLMQAGITGVLCVQTDIDIKHRGVNWPKMVQFYEERGIKAIHYPIHDFNEQDLTEKLFEGAQILNQLINEEDLTVFVHCTAGMGRAPAVVLVYLCLFRPDADYGFTKESEFDLPKKVDLYVKSFRKVSTPNLRAVRNVVAQATELIQTIENKN